MFWQKKFKGQGTIIILPMIISGANIKKISFFLLVEANWDLDYGWPAPTIYRN